MASTTPPTGTTPAAAPQFEANTQWRKAWAFIGHRGRVQIAGGNLVLLDHDGNQVAAGPVKDATIDRPWWTLGNGCYATIDRQKYMLTLRSMGATMASEALGGGIATTVMGRKATKKFMEALEQARGTSG
ncbi:MAG: hypothetical protein ABR498_01150 [Candidatus Dormibacteria bacterium]